MRLCQSYSCVCTISDESDLFETFAHLILLLLSFRLKVYLTINKTMGDCFIYINAYAYISNVNLLRIWLSDLVESAL